MFPHTDNLKYVEPSHLTDAELLVWATKFGGWSFSTVDQELRSPRGVTFRVIKNNIGQDVRHELTAQMNHAKSFQLRRSEFQKNDD